MDNDTGLVKPFFPDSNITFVTVKGYPKGTLAQGVIFTVPKHPILKIALELTLDHYQHRRYKRNHTEVDYDFNLGTKILYDAYVEAIEQDPTLKVSTLLFEEVILYLRKDLKRKSGVKFNKPGKFYCTAAFVHQEEVYFLARAPGTSYC